MGANATYDKTKKEFTYDGVMMGPCGGMANLPGTNGVMVSKLSAGSFSDSV